MTRFHKKAPIMLHLLYFISLCLIAFVVMLFVISPGRLKPFRDHDGRIPAGSISEKIFINIGGVKQGMSRLRS